MRVVRLDERELLLCMSSVCPECVLTIVRIELPLSSQSTMQLSAIDVPPPSAGAKVEQTHLLEAVGF